MTSPSPMLAFEEPVHSPSTSSLSSWHPSTPPSESSICMMAAEAVPNASHSLVEGIRCSASVDGADHQHYPFTEASCVSGLYEGDPRMFGFAADPTQTGFWAELPSQQAWISATHLAQNPTSPSIRGGSDSGSPLVDSHGNNLVPCSRASEPLDVPPAVSDALMGGAFTMTCPIPHCCFQCQTVLDMWRHVTWTHVRPNSKESGIESIVERVVLGGLS
jgi:hypothetical protein